MAQYVILSSYDVVPDDNPSGVAIRPRVAQYSSKYESLLDGRVSAEAPDGFGVARADITDMAGAAADPDIVFLDNEIGSAGILLENLGIPANGLPAQYTRQDVAIRIKNCARFRQLFRKYNFDTSKLDITLTTGMKNAVRNILENRGFDVTFLQGNDPITARQIYFHLMGSEFDSTPEEP